MAESATKGRSAVESDFDKLVPLLQTNCTRMQLEWSNYEVAARQIIQNPDYGFFIVAEEGAEIVGVTFFTFEWSDWRDGAFIWMQGLQVLAGKDANTVITALKSGLEAHKATLPYPCCGVRLCTPKVLHTEAQEAMQAFELVPTHYYIYDVQTPSAE